VGSVIASLSEPAAPPGYPDLAGLILAVLSNPRRPDPTRLPAPAQDDRPASEETVQPPASVTAPLLFGPTGLGTSATRPSVMSSYVAALPTVAEPTSLRLPGLPSGLGTSAVRLAADRGQADTPASEADDSMPELFCPGPVRDDPVLGEVVNEAVVAWAEEVGIYPGRLDRLRSTNFGRLLMLAHPATDDPDRLLAATKCLVAEWATDDYIVDEVELGADQEVVAARLAKLYAVVDPADLPVQYQPQLDEYRREEHIATAFRSAMEHLARYTSVTQIGRFQHQMAVMFLSWNHGAEWHRNQRTPPVWEYLVQRHFDSFLPGMILIDSLAGYELPPNEYYDPRVRRAFKMAGAANALINDLHSTAFEDDFNLPRVIVAEEGCSHREAIKRTVEIHNELMHTFVAEAGALSLIGSPMLRRFFLDTWAWLGGSREWHATTRRYKRDDDG